MNMITRNLVIEQASLIMGKTIKLRNVEPGDAEFIVKIRTNEKKGRFISSTSNDVGEQAAWIERYLVGEGQAYFMITDFKNQQLGTVRMYDQQGDSFCWGSWVVAEDAPPQCAVESALLIYTYALELGFKNAHFDVRKGNASVIKFHERFGAERTGETEHDILFVISESNIRKTLEKYKKFLPEKTTIIR